MLTAIFLLLLAIAQPASLPQDPAALTFEVSPDHDAVDANGPRVVKYLIDFSPVDGLGTAKTVDLGKPVPDAGVIRVLLAPLQLAPGRYLAQVRVQGQTMTVSGGSVGPFQLGKPKPRKPPEAAAAPAAPPRSPDPAPEAGPAEARKGGFWRRLYGLIVGH